MAGLFAAIWLGMRGAVAIKDEIDNTHQKSVSGYQLPNGEYTYTDKNGAIRNSKGEQLIRDGYYYRTYKRGRHGRIVCDTYSDKNAKSMEFSKSKGYIAHYGYAWQTEKCQLIENSTGKIITQLTREPALYFANGWDMYFLRNSDGSIQQKCEKYYLDESKPEIKERKRVLNDLRNGIECYSDFLEPFEGKLFGSENSAPLPISEYEFEKLNVPNYITPAEYLTGEMRQLYVYDEKHTHPYGDDYQIRSDAEHEYIKRLKKRYKWFAYMPVDEKKYPYSDIDLDQMVRHGFITHYREGKIPCKEYRYYFNKKLTEKEMKKFNLTLVEDCETERK